MSAVLKPCPFCGSENVREHCLIVNCEDCGAEGGMEDHSASAADYWNRRPAPKGALTDALPTLPQSLINLIGEYGMARTDGLNTLDIQDRWLLLIAGIKQYAAQCIEARNQQGDAIPDHAALGKNGVIYHGIEEIYHQMEEAFSAHKMLDEANVPRVDVGGEVFSLWGRVNKLNTTTVADAERYRWLCEDIGNYEHRLKRNELLHRMPVMSYSAATRDIDAAIEQRKADKKGGRVMRVYPLEIENVGEDFYTLMSRGHHDPADFMLAARADGFDWPLGMPKHIWLRCIPPPDGYATWYVEAKEGARGAFPATQVWEAYGDETYEAITAINKDAQ